MFANILTSNIEFEPKEELLKQRFILLNSILLISAFTAILVEVLNILHVGQRLVPLVVVVNFVYVLLNLALLLFLRNHKERFFITFLILQLLSTISFSFVYVGAVDNFKAIWFFFVVVISFYFGGQLIGVLTYVFIAILLVVLSYELGMSAVEYSSLITAEIGLAVFAFIFMFYQRTFNQYNNYLQKHSLGLSDLVEAKDDQLKQNITSTRRILKNSMEGIVLVLDGELSYANDVAHKMFSDELLERLLRSIDYSILDERFEYSLAVEKTKTMDLQITIQNIHIENAHYQMLNILDLSELKQKERLLLKQSKLATMGEMMSMIAHQWRQPLGAIAALVTLTKLRLQTENVAPEANRVINGKLDEMSQQVQFLSKTIEDFSNIYKPSTKKEFFTPKELVDLAIKLVKNRIMAHNIALQEWYDCHDTVLYNYKNELMHVVINIINNAIDAYDDKEVNSKFINIRTHKTSDWVTIQICDNAGGVEKSVENSIFEPYVSTKDEKHGTGLGLYMSKNIVEQHCNGVLDYENANGGVCFRIQLAYKT